MKTNKFGKLTIVTGPMYSGKTEKILQLINKAEYRGKTVLAVKYKLDNRYSDTKIVSHFGRDLKAEPASTIEEINKLVQEQTPKVIAIDEAQFIKGIKQAVRHWVSSGLDVFLSTLDLDCWEEPWQEINDLLCYADKIYKLTAVCPTCKKNATRTQLLVDPSVFKDGSNVLIGGNDLYEPRCKNHFTPAKPLNLT